MAAYIFVGWVERSTDWARSVKVFSETQRFFRFDKSVAKTGMAMVNFNNEGISTLQIFKNFIVFIVSRHSDAERKRAIIQSWTDLHVVFIGCDATPYYEKL